MSEETRDGVVVGFDGSIPARLAVYWGVQEAASRQWPLRLVHVFRWPLSELAGLGTQVKPLTRDHFHEVATEAVTVAVKHCTELAPGVPISSDVVTGDPVTVLAEMADQARLLVLGSNGQTGADGMIVGSSSAELARRAASPVVVVRGNARFPMDDHRGRVVVGVDGSPGSLRALEFAFDYASRHSTELVAVHAWSDLPLQSMNAVLAEDIDEGLVRIQARALVTGVLAGLVQRDPSVRVREVVQVDRPAQALLEQSHGAALIVVGSHGRAKASHVPLGSVSHVLLHYADCPVAIVRTPSLIT